jgi:hypothetical protein
MRDRHVVMSLFCAWVLWQYLIDPSSGARIVVARDSFSSIEECKKESAARIKGLHPDSLVCLPDTIDPRTPKAR